MKVGYSYYIKILCSVNGLTAADVEFSLTKNDGLGIAHSYWSKNYERLATAITSTITEDVADSVEEVITLEVVLINVTVAGSLTLKFAQDVADASNTVFRVGSFMVVTEVK